jgi:hypothetical protein
MPDWSLIGDRAHVVQFYEEDSTLIELLSRYVGVALVAGDSAVVIGTKKHRDDIVSRLAARGLDVSIARSQGRYVSLDAAQTLAKFVRDGRPDPERFMQLIGGVFDSAARAATAGRHRVVAFGEMVALLWAQAKVDAALQVEELWNRLAERHTFSLCCAYPMNGFVGNPHAAPFLKICAQHSHVFPAERKVRSTLAAV